MSKVLLICRNRVWSVVVTVRGERIFCMSDRAVSDPFLYPKEEFVPSCYLLRCVLLSFMSILYWIRTINCQIPPANMSVIASFLFVLTADRIILDVPSFVSF